VDKKANNNFQRLPFLVSGLILLFTFSCTRPEVEQFSLPDGKDVNSIVQAIFAHDSLPVYKDEDFKDTVINGCVIKQAVLAIDTNLVKLYVIKSDTSRPMPFSHLGPISTLIRSDIKGEKYFSVADSSYLMFQNDNFKRFSLSTSDFPKINTKTHFGCIRLSIPIFSKNKDVAYVELSSGSGTNGYVLKKTNANWIVVQTIGISIA
jgi:hypothetical protein